MLPAYVLVIVLLLPQTITSHPQRAPLKATAPVNSFSEHQLHDRPSIEAYDTEHRLYGRHGRRAHWSWLKLQSRAVPPTQSQPDLQADAEVPTSLNASPQLSQFTAPEQQPQPQPQQLHHSYAAACAIMRNEHCDVREWVEYHLYIGVGKFYIFDHASTPPLANVLADHLAAGRVEILSFSNSWQADGTLPRYANNSHGSRLTPQSWAYDNCILWFGDRHKWIALVDADEFLIITPGAAAAAAAGSAPNTTGGPSQPPQLGQPRPNITEYLQPLEGVGAIRLHWKLFGPSSHNKRPVGCTLQHYDRCLPADHFHQDPGFLKNPAGYMKSIINTKYWTIGCNPHVCPSSRPSVLADGSPYNKTTAQVVRYDTAYIHHYVTRSQEDYVLKRARGTGNTQYIKGAKMRARPWKFFKFMQSGAKVLDSVGKELAAACCPQSCGSTEPCPFMHAQPPHA